MLFDNWNWDESSFQRNDNFDTIDAVRYKLFAENFATWRQGKNLTFETWRHLKNDRVKKGTKNMNTSYEFDGYRVVKTTRKGLKGKQITIVELVPRTESETAVYSYYRDRLSTLEDKVQELQERLAEKPGFFSRLFFERY